MLTVNEDTRSAAVAMAEELIGGSQGPDAEMLQEYFGPGAPSEMSGLPLELLLTIDDVVFCCACCGWWYAVEEMSDDGETCSDCKEGAH